jgi:guanyl-specific ribonuclease Sa
MEKRLKSEANIASSNTAASVTSPDDADDNKTALTTSLSTSNTPASSKASKKSGAIASKGVVSNELSQSTLMINSISSDSPLLRSKTNSKDNGGRRIRVARRQRGRIKKGEQQR